MTDPTADLDALDEDGLAPLHHAAMRADDEVSALLARGAHVEVRSEPEGATPLHFAAAMHRLDAVRALLGAGARATARDHEGATPLLAVLTSTMPFGTGSVLVAHLLREAGDDGFALATELASAPEMVQSLASLGFRVATADPVGAALDELAWLADTLEMSWDAEAHGYEKWAAPRLAIVAERLPLALATLPAEASALDGSFFARLRDARVTTLTYDDRKRLRDLRARRAR